jgi:hypothetical protein
MALLRPTEWAAATPTITQPTSSISNGTARHNPPKHPQWSPEANAAAGDSYRDHLGRYPELIAAARVELTA